MSEDYEPNSRIRDAAPELLEKLKNLVRWIEDQSTLALCECDPVGDPSVGIYPWVCEYHAALALIDRLEGKPSDTPEQEPY